MPDTWQILNNVYRSNPMAIIAMWKVSVDKGKSIVENVTDLKW